MIKVYAKKNEETGEYMFKVKGHCNTAEYGKDLVCAAVSILSLTLAQTIKFNNNLLDEKPQITIHQGKAKIIFKPKSEYEAQLRISLNTVMNGFRVLQNEYPKIIHIK